MIDYSSWLQRLENWDSREFDPKLSERFDACCNNGFPICLHEALLEVYGKIGSSQLERVADNFVPNSISNPTEIWKLYLLHVQEYEKRFGADAAKIIGYAAINRMVISQCEKCPVYRFELER